MTHALPTAGDLIGYTAEEGVRYLGEGKLLMSDSFPGQERSKLCLSSKVGTLRNAFAGHCQAGT